LIATFASFGQTNYYVSQSGNNSNTGLSPDQAWETINFAAQNANVTAGSTVNILAGTYNEKVEFTISGAADNLITFQNYQNDNVILSGSTLPAYEFMMKIENQHHIKIKGLKFQDYQQLDAIGIIMKNSSYIYIENNEFSNIDYSSAAVGQTPNENQNSQPIIVFGTLPNNIDLVQGISITGNSIHDCEVGWSECISINGNVDGFEIANNTIYNNTNIGIVAIGFEGECSNPDNDQARNGHIHHNLVYDNPSAYSECAGIYIDGGAYMNVENNILYGNDFGIEIGCENNGSISGANANNNIVQNNLIYNNKYTGIALGGFDYPTSGFVEYTIIRNNTLYNNDTDNNYQGEMLITYVENSLIENNIFYTNNTDKVLFSTENMQNSVSFNYNLYNTPSGSNDIVIVWNGTEYNSFAAYKTGTSQDANSLFADPLFADNSTTNPDLHLQSTSPAKDAGNPATVPDGEDMDGEVRINGSRVDIGADEYYSNTNISDVNASNIAIYPNPANDFISIKSENIIIKKLEIIDISGKIVYSKIAKNQIFDISDLKSGIYFVEIHTNSEILMSKIIKE
jgi:hypothetical protein